MVQPIGGTLQSNEAGKSPPCVAVCQNLVPLVNIKIAGKWMFIPLKMVLIGIDPYPFEVPLVYKQHAGTHLPV